MTQDVFLKLVNNIRKYRFIGKFSNFIFTIAVNVCNDYFRKKKISIQDDFNLNMLKDHIDMLAQIENDDNVAHLRKAIDTLPHMQKEALVLRFVYELKFREIARITNSSTSTVKSRIYQGLAKLKKILLEDKYFEDR